MTSGKLTTARAAAFAAELDVHVDCGICLACLSFVSMAVDGGDERKIAAEARRMTPYLWSEGLSEPALAAARAARRRGAPHGELAYADLQERGGRSPVARALVRRLAEELSRETHEALRFERLLRRDGPAARPDLN